MYRGACQRAGDRLSAIRSWPVFTLPRWVIVFIAAVTAGNLIAIGFAASSTTLPTHDLVLFGILLACDAATVEITRRAGENAGFTKDVNGVWELPVAVLLPPLYVLLIPIIRVALVQWRVRRAPAHRRVLTASAISLSFGAASVFFHTLARAGLGLRPGLDRHALVWIMAVAACGLIEWAVNQLLVAIAIKGSDPLVKLREELFQGEPLHNDMTELCVAVVVTLGVAISPVVPLFAFPFVTLLQRSLRHAQLVNASRIDSKTGLLNAGTWEREAVTQVIRAARTQTPLAVVLLDIDHFKDVNDRHGHLAGDEVLRALAGCFRDQLREYDLIGRFGGEEFALLLPQTTGRDAFRIAERIRSRIADLPVASGSGPQAQIVTVTASLGVAVLDASRRDLTELLAAADAALYRAKQDGRNRVHMVTSDSSAASTGLPAEADAPTRYH